MNKSKLEISVFGNKYWNLNGEHHRTDGPAIIYTDGHKEWWLNGKRHREDGPAIEGLFGYKEYWLYGIEYSFEEWRFQQLTLEQQYNYLWDL
jgi:hypothetical protein